MRQLRLKCAKCKADIVVDAGFEGMTIRCSKCGAFNELPVDKVDDEDLGGAVFDRPDSPVSEEAEEENLIVSRSYGAGDQGAAAYCPHCRKRLGRPRGGVAGRLACASCGRAFRITEDNRLVEEELSAVIEEEDTPEPPPAPNIRATIPDAPTPTAKTPHALKKLVNSIGMEFLLVTPGSFRMGSPADEEGRDDDEQQHVVKITRPYYLGVAPVTQAQWQAVMKETKNPSSFKGDHLPVERVSYVEALAFCEALSAIRPKWWQRLSTKGETGRHYRLPTEAEWEYACRAGSHWPFWTGRKITTEHANFDGRHPYGGGAKGKFRGRTSPVNRFPPNPWGFHDMHGNVAEWVADYHGPFTGETLTDPKGPEHGIKHVVRGGSWHMPAQDCRCAARLAYGPDVRYNDTGFRLALDLVDE